jgi:hypothetical protein
VDPVDPVNPVEPVVPEIRGPNAILENASN